MDFQTFHKYNRLVARGLAKPLCCKHCDNPWVLRLGEDDAPVLSCISCNTTVTPGLGLYRDVQAAVKEYFI